MLFEWLEVLDKFGAELLLSHAFINDGTIELPMGLRHVLCDHRLRRDGAG